MFNTKNEIIHFFYSFLDSLSGKNLESLEKSMKKVFTDSYKNIDDEFLKEAKSR